jgi:thiamine-phosphate pyrophosphorylase
MPDHPLLYYITDRTAFFGNESQRRSRLLEKIAEAARAGVDYIQLREKDLSIRQLESLAKEAVRIIFQLRTENPERKTALLMNSRTDVAMAVQADGVHLRSNDVAPEEVREMWSRCGAALCRAGAHARELFPTAPLIAVSCHSPAEVTEVAVNGAAFAVFAPVFEKKAVSTQPAGLMELREACRATIPVLALGGITLQNAHSCLKAGAAGIAAIRLFQENEIAVIVKQLKSNS